MNMNPKILIPAVIAVGVIVLLGGVFLVSQTPVLQPSPTPIPTPQPAGKVPDDWLTYRNEEFGFEVKYPPTHNVWIGDPLGKKYPSFVSKEIEGGFEPPSLTLNFEPIAEIDQKQFQVESSVFVEGEKQIGYTAIQIILTDSKGNVLENVKGQKIYATCVLDDILDKEGVTLEICNKVISTIKI
jgi:hypothetical protein